MNALSNEKFISSPCRELHQYLVLEKGFDEYNAQVFINHAKRALASNTQLSKLSPSKLFDTLDKVDK